MGVLGKHRLFYVGMTSGLYVTHRTFPTSFNGDFIAVKFFNRSPVNAVLLTRDPAGGEVMYVSVGETASNKSRATGLYVTHKKPGGKVVWTRLIIKGEGYRTLVQTKSGKVYAGSNRGLYIISGRTKTEVADGCVLSLQTGSTGFIFVGTDQGVYLFGEDSHAFTKMSGTSDSVTCLVQLGREKYLAGTRFDGVWLYENARSAWRKLEKDTLPDAAILSAAYDPAVSHGDIFLGTDQGLYPGTLEGTWQKVNGSENLIIYSLLEKTPASGRAVLWVGSDSCSASTTDFASLQWQPDLRWFVIYSLLLCTHTDHRMGNICAGTSHYPRYSTVRTRNHWGRCSNSFGCKDVYSWLQTTSGVLYEGTLGNGVLRHS